MMAKIKVKKRENSSVQGVGMVDFVCLFVSLSVSVKMVLGKEREGGRDYT